MRTQFNKLLYVAMNPIEFQNSFNRAVTVFFMALAALVAPAFILSGLNEEWQKNLIPGVSLFFYLMYWLIKAISQIKNLPKSDKVAFILIPLCVLPLGLVLALAGASN